MWQRRPTEPAVLSDAKSRLTEQLERAWTKKRSRGPEPDAVLHAPEILDALLQRFTMAPLEEPRGSAPAQLWRVEADGEQPGGRFRRHAG